MRTIISATVLMTGLTLLTGCSEPTLEEELDDYCSCVKEASGEEELEECRDQIEGIVDKYGYDPEAAEEIKNHLIDCATN